MIEVERRELSPGYSISRVINGCWQLAPDHGGGPGSEAETHRIFADLVDHGFTTFDCADIYIGVEETIGQFRKSLANPESIQIHTKYAANRDTLHELNSEEIDAAIDRSLVRLGVGQIDLLQYHWWNYDVPGLENLTDRMLRAQQAGKIRLLGVTNFDTPHVREIVESGAPIVSLQTQYSMLDRRPERLMTAFCADSGVRLLPYGVLAGGFLSERYLGAGDPQDMNRSLVKYRLIIEEAGGWDAFQDLLVSLKAVADRHGCAISTVAARWTLDQPAVAAVMLGVGSRSRAARNQLIANLRLGDDDRSQIAAALDRLSLPPRDMYELERDMDGRHSKIIKMNLHDDPENQ